MGRSVSIRVSGSGTTTLGRVVAERFDYLHLDTDDDVWLPTDLQGSSGTHLLHVPVHDLKFENVTPA